MSKNKKQDNDSEVIWVFIGLGILIYAYTKSLNIALIGSVLSISIYFLIIYLKAKKKRDMYLNSGINIVDNMDGVTFEEFLLAHFQNLGYKGNLTPKTNDYGADLIVNKDGQKIVVQAKRYTDKVGIAAIQQIIGAKGHYKADKALVVTNSLFTPNAINLATSNSVELWDRNKLIEVMGKENAKECIETLDIDTSQRICKECGAKMKIRNGKHGAFYGCSNYPKCRYTEKV